MCTGKAESDVNVPSMSTACDDCGKIHRAAAQNGKILDIDCIVFKGLEDYCKSRKQTFGSLRFRYNADYSISKICQILNNIIPFTQISPAQKRFSFTFAANRRESARRFPPRARLSPRRHLARACLKSASCKPDTRTPRFPRHWRLCCRACARRFFSTARSA